MPIGITNTVQCPQSLLPQVVSAYRDVLGTMAAPGFLGFYLLEPVIVDERPQEVVSLTFWEDEQAFGAWRRGDLFQQLHRCLGEEFGDLHLTYSIQKYRLHLQHFPFVPQVSSQEGMIAPNQ